MDKVKNNTSLVAHEYIAFASTIIPYLEQEIDGKKYVIVFYGRLYNLQEIQKNLVSLNYSIDGSTIQTVLMSFIHYKEKCLELFNGAFSFAIYTSSNDTLFIARDRLGIKPIFYTSSIFGDFVFSSEIKALLQHPEITAKISKNEICEIFGLGPAHTPGKTFFKDIFELLPGHYAIYNKNGIYINKYWDLESFEVDDNIYSCILNIKKLVNKSFNTQFSENSNICCMLSGGLDSSILTYLAKQRKSDLNTFSIDFENNNINFKGNDYQPTRDNDFIQIIKDFLNTKHTEISFNNDELFNTLKNVVIARDAPGMGDVDSSMYIFCKKIKEKGFSVALSGECSDEIFGGYPWYYKEHLIGSSSFPWSKSFNLRKNLINKKIISEEYLKEYIDSAYNNTCKNVKYISSDEFENNFRKTCYLTTKWFMNTLLERTDRAALANNLDIRIPFADYRLFEYVYNVSAKFKLGLINNNLEPIEKYLLRKTFENYLPSSVIYRKKSPFPKTYDPTYTNILEKEIERIIRSSTAPLLEIIDIKYLIDMLSNHGKNLTENWFGQLMTYPQTLAYLIQINIWLKEYNVILDI